MIDKPGYIYIAHIHHKNVEWKFENELYKIGYTRFLKSRLLALKHQWNQEVEYIAFSPVSDVISKEKELHGKYREFECSGNFAPWIGNLSEYFLFEEFILNNAILSVWEMCDSSSSEKISPVISDCFSNIYKENEQMKIRILELISKNEKIEDENIRLKLKLGMYQ